MAPTNSISNGEQVSEMQEKLKDIVKENGIAGPISEVIVRGTGLTAENFGSTAGYATVKFEDESKEPLHLFTKKPVQAGAFKEMMTEWGLFEGEVEFFGKYFPKAMELCNSKGQADLLNIYPKCFHVDDNLIVFENLVLGDSFIMLNKVDQQDFEQAAMALANLAKHHAISYAVIKEYKGGPDEFFRDMPAMKESYIKLPVTRPILDPMFEAGTSGCLKILEKTDVAGKEATIARLRSLEGTGYEDSLKGFEVAPDEFSVICHGDYHNNNMMLKKDANGKFVDHKVIDLQTVWCGTPGNDIGHFLFSSVKSKVRQERLDELLLVYLDTLNNVTAALGHPANLTKEKLLESYCRHFQFGFWIGMQLTQCGGWEIMKEFGELATEDVKLEDMQEKMTKASERWMNSNPERCTEYGKSIVQYVKEYDRLKQGL